MAKSSMAAGSVAVPTIIPLKDPQQRPKSVINSNIKIEIQTDTKETVILYSIDGSCPQATFRHGQLQISKPTFRYKSPFLLSPGKVVVKALAMIRDGSRESSVVTKQFTINEAEDSDETEQVVEEIVIRSPSPLPSISSQLKQKLDTPSLVSLVTGSLDTRNLPTSSPLPPQPNSSGSVAPHASPPPRRTNVEKPQPCCVYCKAPRSKAPYYKYCTHCGSRLPPLPKVDPTPPLQMSVCLQCRAQLPPDSTTCFLCEGDVQRPPVPPHINGQTNTPNQCKELCLACGTSNPLQASHCVTCEKSLPIVSEEQGPASSPISYIPPPLPNLVQMIPISGSSYLVCGACGRVNVSDARYCDWCGGKPAGSQLSVVCAGCSTANEWHSRHCFNCASLIKAPLRPEVELSSTMKIPSIADKSKNAWIPVVELLDKGPEVKTRGTQTVGLFYPSSYDLNKAMDAQILKQLVTDQARDRIPLLQDYSPGKGLWRMQVQHLCARVKAHAQSSTGFQTAIGPLQIGKLVNASTSEHGIGQCVVTLTFDLHPDDTVGNSSISGSPVPTRNTQHSNSVNLTHLTTPTIKENNSSEEKHVARVSIQKLKGDTGKLANELSASGQGRRSVVEALIQKGADVNAVHHAGLHLLSLAVSNGHLECIAPLVEGGASINGQDYSTGNTALHQAVITQSSRLDCVEELLRLSANPRIKNKAALTPCEVAIRFNSKDIVTCFASYAGNSLLKTISQPIVTL